MPDPPLLLQVEHVARRYDSPGGAAPLEVLKDVSLALGAGESVAVVGPSGSGKSTLLNIIGTLDRPTSGRVVFEGHDLADLGDGDLAALRNQGIGFVFQMHHLLPQCSVLENVLVPTLAGGGHTTPPEADADARRLLDRVGLGSHLAHRPGQLSGGECQRVAVARALINRPRLLLADEPTGALDRASAESLTELLVDLNREEGVAMIVVTHAAALAQRMGRVLQLVDGCLVPMEGPA